MQACAYRNLSVQYFKADSSRESSPSCERGNRPFLMDNSDMILYLSYWYTGRRVSSPISIFLSVSLNTFAQLPIRLAWFWTSSQLGETNVTYQRFS